MARSERVVLVDGSWLVFRAFFAIPANLKTKEGFHTNAVFGFATMFRKLFAGRAPDFGAVVFDSPARTFREERFAAYKAQRPSMPGDLRLQLPFIDRVVAANGFPVIRVPGYEADDVIATLARQAANEGKEVVIVAGDKDLAQVVSDSIRMQDTMKDVVYDAELVRKKWGVPPVQIPELLALVGDTVDNLPGVPGIGAKGAVQLLARFGSIEGILANAQSLTPRQRDELTSRVDEVRMYRDLATIDCNVPLPVELSSLEIPPLDRTALDVLYRELEFYSLLEGGVAQKAVDATRTQVTCHRTAAAARRELAALPEASALAICPIYEPVEQPARAHFVGLGLSGVGTGVAFYVPVRGEDVDPGNREVVREVLADQVRKKVTHDRKVLEMVAAREDMTLGGEVFDTMLASFLVDPEKCIPHRLEQVAKEYVQLGVPPIKALTFAGQKARLPSAAPCEEAASWAGECASIIASLLAPLEERLTTTEQWDVYDQVEAPLSSVLGRMELVGIRVDREDLGRMTVEFTARKNELEQRIHELAGHPFNIGSPKQLADVLFEELRLPVVKKTKTGYSTDAEVLERLAPKHEIARLVLAQREVAKLINTYTEVLSAAIWEETGRVHARVLQTTGVSGRLITTDPDLQRTPVRTAEGKRIRRAFIASPGSRIIAADWSQIELRVLSHFSRDARLLSAFEEGLDLHRRTASVLFGIGEDEVSAEQRNVGKTINFATIYGQGATALGQILGIKRAEAQRYIEQYFEFYCGVREWLDRTIEDAHHTGYVTTLLGRRRFIAELASRNATDRAAGERIAANTPIQGSAADLCKLAMLKVDRGLRSENLATRMLLSVHDELVFEAPEEEVERVVELVREAMLHPYPHLTVPLVIDLGVGSSWGEAKESRTPRLTNSPSELDDSAVDGR